MHQWRNRSDFGEENNRVIVFAQEVCNLLLPSGLRITTPKTSKSGQYLYRVVLIVIMAGRNPASLIQSIGVFLCYPFKKYS